MDEIIQLDRLPQRLLTAVEVAKLLNEAVPQARIAMGADPSQLVIWATPKDHEVIKKLRSLVKGKLPSSPDDFPHNRR